MLSLKLYKAHHNGYCPYGYIPTPGKPKVTITPYPHKLRINVCLPGIYLHTKMHVSYIDVGRERPLKVTHKCPKGEESKAKAPQPEQRYYQNR